MRRSGGAADEGAVMEPTVRIMMPCSALSPIPATAAFVIAPVTPIPLHDPASLRALIGQEVVVTDWIEITQQRVDAFAAATDDHQWIHVDPVRARAQTPFGNSIAHGFLTLSLLSKFINESIDFGATRMGINYGLNRVRFTDPVPVGSRLRGRFVLGAVDDLEGGVQMTWKVTVERDGAPKPCLVAEWLTRRYY